MKRIIYSLYIDVPEKEHFGKSKFKHDTLDRASKTRNSFKKNYKKLIYCKKKYAENIGADFQMFESDEQYFKFSKKLSKNFSFLTEYEIVNFYKIYLLYELVKQYDEILYLDFDAVPVTNESFFEKWNLSKGVCVYNNNNMVNKMRNSIDKMNYGVRSPTAKFYNTQAMLISTGQNPYNDVLNTGIIGINRKNILKLNFFDDFNNTILLMSKLKDQGLDNLYPQNIIDMFRYDNETIFSYKVQTNKIDIQWLDKQWHYFFDTQFYIPKDTKIVHTINKDFDTVWRFYEKCNF